MPTAPRGGEPAATRDPAARSAAARAEAEREARRAGGRRPGVADPANARGAAAEVGVFTRLRRWLGGRSQSLETVQSRGNGLAGPLSEELLELGPWFHNLHLPEGVETAPDHPLGDFPAFKWAAIGRELPEDLSGWRVLDIGCNAGFYSFVLAERGAQVLGIDSDAHYLRQARWAAQRHGLGVQQRVTFRQMQVYELARMREEFDLVLFMGVFYHLRYPILALDAVARRCGHLLVFQSLSTPGERVDAAPPNLPLSARRRLNGRGWPKMSFVEHRLAGDPTNYWLPNRAACEALLRDAGFDVLSRPAPEIYIGRRRDEPGFDEEAREAEFRAATGLDREV